MQKYLTTLKVSAPYILVSMLTVAAWLGVMELRGMQTSSCSNSCQTFTSYVRHDPYCVIDPACISPFYNPDWARKGTTPQFMPHWQGLAWLGEAGTYGTGLHMLAIPNYIGFMLLLCLLVMLIERRIPDPLVRRLLLTVVTAWLILEILRWFADISDVDPTVPFFNGEFFVTLAGSLLIIWGMARLARPAPVSTTLPGRSTRAL
jgi:hypothetical protein